MLFSEAPVETINEAYRQALVKAKDYGNKVYEFRAAFGFAQYCIAADRAQEVRVLLQSTFESVTEFGECRDLVAAKNLLRQLRN